MRIAHVIAPARVGGLEAVVQGLALGCRDRGHEVTILATISSEDAPLDSLASVRDSAIDLVPLVPRPRRYDDELRGMLHAMQSRRIEVVHTHGYRSDVIGGMVARRLRLPSVSTVHGFTGGGWRNRCYEWVQMRALRRASAVVAVSGGVADRLRDAGVPAARVHVIPNGHAGAPPLTREAARAALRVPAGVRLGWVGRLSREKGVDVLLQALGTLRDLAWELSLIGEGPERGRLERVAASLGIDERIRWHGIVAGAGRLHTAFDLFVLPSRTEGTPMVLLEAMAAGVPIVATAVGGVPDMLDETSAWLVPSEDARRLAGAIRESLSDPSAGQRRAASASIRLGAHGISGWLDRYEALYRGLSPDTAPATENAG